VQRRRSLGLAAIAVLALASAVLLQPFGYNQGAHYALVQALAHGTPRINAYASYSGDLSSFHGHLYSNKAPGLALATLPAYFVLHTLGLPSGVHALSLWSVLLPALGILLLVRSLAERLEPGLLLPFTGLFFAHALSAFLGFAAFAVLWREREGPQRLALVAGAGALAGLAITTEYPLAIVAVVLGGYAIARRRLLRRALAYGAGLAAGLAPLLLYQLWAFGTVLRTTYAGQLVHTGTTGPGIVRETKPGGLGGRAHVALELLFSYRGLLTLAPIVSVGAVGLVLLYRRGKRAEAAAIAALSVVLLVAISGGWGAFGGWGPGPRYLITTLPFLAVPLALAFRARPVTTVALALVSIGAMTVATATEPLLPNNTGRVGVQGDVAHTDVWFDRLRDGNFTRTILSSAGAGQGWLAIAPFLLLIALALGLAAFATAWPRARKRDVLGAAVALGGWALCVHFLPELLRDDYGSGGSLGAGGALIAVLAVAAVVVAAVYAGGASTSTSERPAVASSSKT
jgi:hypothetical protein